ncbi:MAG: hypothetical protein GX115_10970 [Ruminiclostridium sp.]|nr:hypothetical protein [Ruminiclostridium sp.]
MSKQEQTVIRQLDTAVRINNVTKHFEQWQRSGQGKNIVKNLFKPEKKVVCALEDISFRVKKGEFLAYAGPNGAGKSRTGHRRAVHQLERAGDVGTRGDRYLVPITI